MSEFGVIASYHKGKNYILLQGLNKGRMIPCLLGLPGFLGNSWDQTQLFPPAEYLKALTSPFCLIKNKAGMTQQISNISLISTWNVVELPFNYNGFSYGKKKKNRNTRLTKARMICLQLIPINTFQVTRLAANWWFSHCKE